MVCVANRDMSAAAQEVIGGSLFAGGARGGYCPDACLVRTRITWHTGFGI